MEKLAYLLWNDEPNRSPDGFRDQLLADLPTPLLEAGAGRVKVIATDSAVEAGAALHLGAHRPDALVTFWLECAQDRAPAEAVLVAACDRLAGYLVAESHPLRVATPEGGLGKRMPGFTLVGCIEPAPGVDHHTFVTTWERVHRDVAIAVQSTFSYVRNEVVRSLTDGAPPWGGIVEEGFPLEALENPQVFYDAVGDDAKYRDHLKQMIDSCGTFLDMEKVDSHPMSEYRFY